MNNSQKTLFILCGLPYAGKSWVAKQLLRGNENLVLVSIDEIFNRHGFDWNANKLPNDTEWAAIFNEAYEVTKATLKEGKSVLFDSTNHTVVSRDALRKVADSATADSLVIYVLSPIEIIWKRWEENSRNPKRPQVSRELVQTTIDSFETPTQLEDVLAIDN